MKRTVNILHIASHLGGGAGKAIVGICLHKIKGCKNRIILLENPQKTNHMKDALVNGVEIDICPSREYIYSCMKAADIVIINWWAHPRMLQFLAELPPINCRLVMWSHINGCTYPYLPFDFCDLFDQIIFTSEYSYNNPLWKRREKHLIWNKSSLTYGMGYYEPYTIMPKFDYEVGDNFKVGYVGTLNYGKLSGAFIDYCVAAIEKIDSIKFILVGEIANQVLTDILNSGYKDKFCIVGHVEDVEKYYLSFDAFGYILNNESYATTENSLIEAMSYGLPVIVANNNLEKCIIHDGLNGYVVNNSEEYADELLYLFENECERIKIGKKARQYVIEKYSEERNFRCFYDACIAALQKEKIVHEFAPVMGEKPIEWFLKFADLDGYVFEKYLANPTFENKNNVKKCKQIFREEAKSSIIHFEHCFPECKEFKKLTKILKEEEET